MRATRPRMISFLWTLRRTEKICKNKLHQTNSRRGRLNCSTAAINLHTFHFQTKKKRIFIPPLHWKRWVLLVCAHVKSTIEWGKTKMETELVSRDYAFSVVRTPEFFFFCFYHHWRLVCWQLTREYINSGGKSSHQPSIWPIYTLRQATE